MGPGTGPRLNSQKADSRAAHRSSHRLNNKILFIKVLSLIPELAWDEDLERGWRRQKTNPGPASSPRSQGFRLPEGTQGWRPSCRKGVFLGGSEFWAG